MSYAPGTMHYVPCTKHYAQKQNFI